MKKNVGNFLSLLVVYLITLPIIGIAAEPVPKNPKPLSEADNYIPGLVDLVAPTDEYLIDGKYSFLPTYNGGQEAGKVSQSFFVYKGVQQSNAESVLYVKDPISDDGREDTYMYTSRVGFVDGKPVDIKYTVINYEPTSTKNMTIDRKLSIRNAPANTKIKITFHEHNPDIKSGKENQPGKK